MNKISFLKNTGILFFSAVISFFLAPLIGELHDKYIETATGFLDLSFFVGFILGFVFLTPLFFGVLGDKKRYWWLGIIWLPVALLHIYLGKYQLLFSLAVVASGIALGYLLRKLKEFIIEKISQNKVA